MKYRYVFFDMDGTVLDTLTDLTDAVNHTIVRFGYAPVTPEQTAYNLGNGARHLLEASMELSAGKGPAAEEETDRILAEYLPYYNSHCRVKTAPYPGTLELMDALKKRDIRMAVVSNKPDAAVQELSELFFGDAMDVSIGECPGVSRKPAPDMVYEAMRRMGLCGGTVPEDLKRQSVYIGDTEVDLQTAGNAGLDCIAVSWGFRRREDLEKAGAAVIADSLAELEMLITGEKAVSSK